MKGYLSKEPDFEVVGEYADGESTWAGIKALRPQVALLDIRMPGRDGITIARMARDAGIPVRIRAVNTRKIFGASIARLRMGFVAETVGLFVVGLAVGYGLVVILTATQMASYLSTSAAIGKNLPLALGFVAVAVVAGILISLYPIFYITSFSPAFVIKGSFQSTRSGRVLRYTLVGVQYVISISLIIVTLFIQMQHNYMMNYD